MKVAKQNNQQDHPLDLIQFLKGLYEAGRIRKEDLQKLVKARKSPKQHVLVFIANQEIGDLKNPGKILDLETLTQILAEQAKQEYYHVDPLSIDAAKVTDVMSHAFAKRHNIMVVKVDSNEVTIASAEPTKEGMSSLRHSGAVKVAEGTTTINEVFRVAPEAN